MLPNVRRLVPVLSLLAVLALAGRGTAQVYVAPACAPPVVSYYAPPVVSYYSAPVVSYYAAPTVSYAAPAVSYYSAPAAFTTTYRYGLFGLRRASVTTFYPGTVVVGP
jgi:hypothetical protein